MEIYDIIIIGAGSVGMFAAFYIGIRQAKTKTTDSLPQLSDQLVTLYPEKYIYDVSEYPAIETSELISQLERRLIIFNHIFRLEEGALSFTRGGEVIEIITNKGTHYSKAVILALGSGLLQSRKLNLDNAKSFENHGLGYFANDLMKYARKKVIITGGGNPAIDWALVLESATSEVYLTHCRPEFRTHEYSVPRLKSSSVNLLAPYLIDGLSGNSGELTDIRLEKAKSDEMIDLTIDPLIANYGFPSNLEHLPSWGLDSTRNATTVKSDMSTFTPGVYAAGDIRTYGGRVKLIATRFDKAPTAANNALYHANSKERTQPGHGTGLYDKNLRPN